MTAELFPERSITDILDQLAERGYQDSFHIEEDTIPPGLSCGRFYQHLLAS